jgi:hypothetical protein
MGTEYYLANKENKTFYELGKGGWCAFVHEMEALTDLEYLEEFIYDDVYDFYDFPPEKPEERRDYCKEIASELFEFSKCKNIKNIDFFNDCGDEKTIIKCLGYRCVGSRYREKGNPKYNTECIENENTHLNPKPESAHLYNLERLLDNRISVYIMGRGYVKLETDQPSPYLPLVERFQKVLE